MSAQNPYALQLAQLVEAAGGGAPAGYAGRLYFHVVANCLVFVLSTVYLFLSYFEHKSRGRKLALVRLQRIQSGNLIVLNTLFVFVIFTALSSVVFIIQKWWQVRIFVQKKAPYDLVIIIIQTWSMPLMSGWTYIFSNFAAALQVGRGRVGFDGLSRVLVSLHNVSFFGVFITFFASTIPIAVYANRASNDVLDATLALMAYLDAASKVPNPADVPDELNAAIANAASTVASRNAVYFKLFRGVVGIATATVILLGIIAVMSLTFVLKIRKQSQWHLTRQTSASVFVSVEQRTVAERDNPDGTVDMTSSSMPEPTVRPVTQHLNLPSFTRNREATKSAKSKAMSQQQKDIAALHRLARDLSVSTPLSLLLCAFMIGCGVSGVVRIDRPHSWAEIELLLDGYGWAWEPIHIIILSTFIYNLTHNPVGSGHWSAQKNSQTGLANAAGTNVLSIQLQAYPAPLDGGLSDVESKKGVEIDEKGFEVERI